MTRKRLHRNTQEGMIAGVASGFSDYFGLDPAIWRLAFIFLVFATGGLFLLVYLVAWILVPRRGQEPVSADYTQ